MFYKSNLYILFSYNYNFFVRKQALDKNKFKFKSLKSHFDLQNNKNLLNLNENIFLDNFLVIENFYKNNNLKNFLYYYFFSNKFLNSNFFWFNHNCEVSNFRNNKIPASSINNLIKVNSLKKNSNYDIIFQSSLIEKNILEAKKNFNDFFFLRKTKIFNKGRYSRNRQIYRTGVYLCLYINILAIYAIYFLFYRFTFNFGFIWFFLFLGVFSFFFSRFFKYNFFQNLKFNLIFFFNWASSIIYSLFLYFSGLFKKILSFVSLLV